MAYFLKVTKPNGGERRYLQIYESFYSAIKKGTAHRSYKALGYEDKLIESGIDDPVSFYKEEVRKMNLETSETRLIDKSPVRYLGYFPLRSVMTKLGIKKFIDLYKLTYDYGYDLFDVFSSLVYARCVNPCSKYKTYQEVTPYLFEEYTFSYDQLLHGLAFLGNNYEKMVELFTMQTEKVYGLDTSKTYFDCTNFYFEIDREDDFRRKGPSKENRKEPLVGLGLLLDDNLIPIGMRMYPGNESEKPVLRDVLDELKKQNNITGKTIQVADKGLNCAENIFAAKKAGDGYLFSKSCKTLPEIEKEWIFLESNWKEKKGKNGELLYRYKSCVDEYPYTYTDPESGKKTVVKLTEKRLVTFNPDLAKKQIHEIDKLVAKAKDMTVSKAKKAEYGDSAKYVNFASVDEDTGEITDTVVAVINSDKIEADKKLAGYNLLVTSEVNMSETDMYETYHQLWRIEESFRIMKSDLDARPVYLQKKETIQGHFLICYIAVLLTRIIQFKILNNEYSSSDLLNFIKEYKVAKSDSGYINLTSKSDFITALTVKTGLPLNNYYLSPTQIKKVLNHKF